jgi:hypothetical protein
MALLGALGGLFLCGIVLAAFRSKRTNEAAKVKTLSLK